MRIGIATITSTALVGGTLVAVPAHPLLPVTAVAQAQEVQQQQEVTSSALAQVLDLSLFSESLSVVNGVSAAQQTDADTITNATGNQANLDLGLLNDAIVIELENGLTVPLIDPNGNGILTGEAGVLGAYAHAPNPASAQAVVGAVGADGTVALDNTPTGVGNPLELDLTNILGVDLPAEVIDELSLSLGAIGASASKEGANAPELDYELADLKLTLDAPVLEGVIGSVNGLVGGLEETVNGALPGSDALQSGLSGFLATIASGLIGVDLNLGVQLGVMDLLNPILNEPLADDSGLASINLAAGTIEVNLEAIHPGGLNDLDPGTPLLDEDAITKITDTVTNLLTDSSNPNSLISKVQQVLTGDSETKTGGLYGTTVELSLELGNTGLLWLLETILTPLGLGDLLNGLVGGIDFETSLGGLLDPDVQATSDRAEYEADPYNYVLISGEGVVGGLLTTVLEAVKGTLSIAGGAVEELLFAQDGLLQGVTGGLGEILGGVVGPLGTALNGENGDGENGVLTPLAGIIINKQTVEDGVHSVTALDVNLLNGTVQLPLAKASVSAQSTPAILAPVLTEITPSEGPRTGGNTVTLTGGNLSYTDIDGNLVEVDTVYVDSYAITEFTIDPVEQTITFEMPDWVVLGITGVIPNVSAETSGQRSNTLPYTYVDTPQTELFDPGYDWVTARPGTTVTVPQTGDLTVPADTTYEIDPGWRGPSGWTFGVVESGPNAGDLSITVPDNAPIGLVFEVPVLVNYSDGTSDLAEARTNVVADPFHIVEIIEGDDSTTIIFSDGSEIIIEHGQDGAAGSPGAPGDSVTIVSEDTDDAGNVTIVFSDGTTVVIPAGTDGADGADGAAGESITVVGSEVNADGDLVVEFSDGTEVVVPKGVDGVDGAPLTVVSQTVDADGNTVIVLSDGSEVTVAKGADGQDGQDGTDGVSVTVDRTYTDADGNTVIVFSDGSEVTVAKGADGVDGDSAFIESQNTDGAGNVTIVFSDGTTVVIPAGTDGADGESIAVVGSEVNADGDLVVEFSDGTEVVVPKGVDGVDGAPLTVVSQTVDADGNTVIVLSDGSEVTVAKGADGQDGADGLSAYELWLEAGNEGSIEEFFESLRGLDGATGADGQPGVDGLSAYELWLAAGNEGSVEDFLASLIGDRGADGKSAYEVWLELPGNAGGSEQDFIEAITGADGQPGQDGADGITPQIGENGNWWLGDFDTGVPARGEDGANGLTPQIGENGNWWIGNLDTGISAQGPKGDKGDRGPSGLDGITAGSSAVGECLAGDSGNILALLAVIGTAAAVGIPLLDPLARAVGYQVGQQVAPGSAQGGPQPAWLVQVNRTLEEVSRSVDSGVVIAAVLGAGILAAFSVAGEACANEGNLSS